MVPLIDGNNESPPLDTKIHDINNKIKMILKSLDSSQMLPYYLNFIPSYLEICLNYNSFFNC
jgi:hypothetical protein